MKYGMGDELIIIDNTCGHHFKIGEMVTVVVVTDIDYEVENAYGEKWWVRDEEVKEYRG